MFWYGGVNSLVFGESVFNDAVVLVMFREIAVYGAPEEITNQFDENSTEWSAISCLEIDILQPQYISGRLNLYAKSVSGGSHHCLTRDSIARQDHEQHVPGDGDQIPLGGVRVHCCRLCSGECQAQTHDATEIDVHSCTHSPNECVHAFLDTPVLEPMTQALLLSKLFSQFRHLHQTSEVTGLALHAAMGV